MGLSRPSTSFRMPASGLGGRDPPNHCRTCCDDTIRAQPDCICVYQVPHYTRLALTNHPRLAKPQDDRMDVMNVESHHSQTRLVSSKPFHAYVSALLTESNNSPNLKVPPNFVQQAHSWGQLHDMGVILAQGETSRVSKRALRAFKTLLSEIA